MAELQGEKKELVQSFGAAALYQTQKHEMFSQDFACQLASMVCFPITEAKVHSKTFIDYVQCTHARHSNPRTTWTLSRSVGCMC
jgi:hypothetical protein